MLSIEVFEYSPKIRDYYLQFGNAFRMNSNENEISSGEWENMSHHIGHNIENKMRKIKTLVHPFVSKYLDFVKDDTNYIFVSEYSGDPLDGIIDGKLRENSPFKLDEVVQIIYQVLLAINYLEKKGIILRFLDTKRILIDELNIKIRNYIVDTLFKPEEVKFLTNFKYLAPELIFFPENNQSVKCVIWSIGSSNEFIKDYIEILSKYKDSSIFLKSEKNVNYDSNECETLIEYYLNGHFTNKEELNDDFKDFLTSVLQIDPDKRKDSTSLLCHPLFSNCRKEVNAKLENTKYVITPLDKEFYEKLRSENSKSNIITSADNYEIFKHILKIDIVTFLKQKGLINYKPKILEIPDYFSLMCISDKNEGDISDRRIISQDESIYENQPLYNEGHLILKGEHIINLPIEYENQSYTVKNIKENFSLISSEQFSTFSDKSSNSSKLSKESLTSQKKTKWDRDITNYFKIKSLCTNIFVFRSQKREELIVELRRMNYLVPPNLRKYVYSILLEVDSLNDPDEVELASYFECKSVIHKEIQQIKKDILRCEEYDVLYKTEEGKQLVYKLLMALLYNKEDFFYTQGMDSIACALVKLFHPDIESAYSAFYKFIKKLLFNFYDLENKTIKNLDFHHLIIKRLFSFIEPELYLYLEDIHFFEEQFATNWILTLFSRTFKFEDLFRIWDILILEDLNIIYIIICLIFKGNKIYIMSNNKETIISDIQEISENINMDSFITEVLTLYKLIPKSLIPLNNEYNEEVFAELKNNEYFKNRWWDFENLHLERYNAPIITLEDTVKIFERVIFVDVRRQLEYENIRVVESYHLSLTKNKYLDATISNLDKQNGNKIVVLVGNQNSNYKDFVNLLHTRRIKYVTILQGGIDIIFTDEGSLIIKK